MGCKENCEQMYGMIAQGQTMEAFEKFYADNVQVTEMPTGEVRNGKEAQRKAIQQWFGMVKDFHGSGHGPITADEKAGVTMIEAWMDISMQDGNRMKMQEVAVQKWENNQIVDEKFYYHMPGQPPAPK